MENQSTLSLPLLDSVQSIWFCSGIINQGCEFIFLSHKHFQFHIFSEWHKWFRQCYLLLDAWIAYAFSTGLRDLDQHFEEKHSFTHSNLEKNFHSVLHSVSWIFFLRIPAGCARKMYLPTTDKQGNKQLKINSHIPTQWSIRTPQMLYLKARGCAAAQKSSVAKSYVASIGQSDLKRNTAINNTDMS